MRIKNPGAILAIILALSLSIGALGQVRKKGGVSSKEKAAKTSKKARYANQEVSYRRSRSARSAGSPDRTRINNVFLGGGNDSWNTRQTMHRKSPRKRPIKR
jgi:hypothetical protein